MDLRQIQLKSLRSQISPVLQDPFVLPLTIAENIGYGLPGAVRSQMIQPGRQKQRLAIARVLLKDAPILIVDEPTSTLDVSTEAAIACRLD